MGISKPCTMSRDEAKATEALTALFAKVDKNGNGELDLAELQRVFGEHADQFLKFCDKDSDKAITCDEWLAGIIGDTADLSEEDFNEQWVTRMDGCVAAADAAEGSKKKVLMVCTSVDKFPDGSATGWYLPEVAHPYQVFVDAGIEVTWASIAGGEAPCDPGSVEASADDAESMAFWNDKDLVAKTSGATGKLDDFKAEDFDAIFFAGGFGVMWDFPESEAAQKLVVDFYEAGKPTAAVCHGPIVFKNIKLTDGSVLVAGKEVTGFTNAEEAAVGKTEAVAEPSGPGSCEDALTAAGATFKDGGVFQANVCIAGALITGQNPPSAKPTAEALVQALK